MEDIGENQVKIARLQTVQTTNATVHFFTGRAVRSILLFWIYLNCSMSSLACEARHAELFSVLLS